MIWLLLSFWLQNPEQDATFGSNSRLRISQVSQIDAVAALPDLRVVAAGTEMVDFIPQPGVMRLLEDGAFDPSFGGTGFVSVRQSGSMAPHALFVVDTRIIVVCERGVVALTDNGAVDTAFGNQGWVLFNDAGDITLSDAFLDDQNRVVVAGWKAFGEEYRDMFVARLHADGSYDDAFGINGKRTYSFLRDEWLVGIEPTYGGRMMIAVRHRNGEVEQSWFGMLDAQGRVDGDWATAGWLHAGLPDLSADPVVTIENWLLVLGAHPPTGRFFGSYLNARGIPVSIGFHTASGAWNTAYYTREDDREFLEGPHQYLSYPNGRMWLITSQGAQHRQYDGTFIGRDHVLHLSGDRYTTAVITADGKLLLAGKNRTLGDTGAFQRLNPNYNCEAMGRVELSSEGESCQSESPELVVTAPGALAYQWFKNGVPIEGAEAARYAPPSGAGPQSYHCVVLGDCPDDMVATETITFGCPKLAAVLGTWWNGDPDATVCGNRRPRVTHFVAYVNAGFTCPIAP